MFAFYDASGVFWFNGACTDSIREYNLVGVLMGLAVYNAIILDIRFPLACYKKLLTPAFVREPTMSSAKTQVGVIKPTLADFRTIRPVDALLSCEEERSACASRISPTVSSICWITMGTSKMTLVSRSR